MMPNKLLFGIKTATLVPNKTQASGLKGQEDDYGRNAGQCGHAALHFFNAEKRIADCVLEDTAGVAAMTSAELAHCSSTSEATVTRFCKKLGFENYRAFQLALARDVMERQPLEISNEVQLDNIPQFPIRSMR